MPSKQLPTDLRRSPPKHPRQKLKLTTGIPKSVNHAYYKNGTLRADVRRWMLQTKASVFAQMDDQKFKKENDEVWWYVDCTFYFPDLRIRDNHNTFKILFDTIQGTFFENDYFRMPRVQGCYLDRENPRLEMVIHPQKVKK